MHQNLSQNVDKIQVTLAKQITEDFKDAFSHKSTATGNASSKQRLGLNQLTDACKVISVLDPKVKKELLKWFIGVLLENHFFYYLYGLFLF